jgi:hypothetical protein
MGLYRLFSIAARRNIRAAPPSPASQRGKTMQKTLLAAFAAGAVLSGVALGAPALAMPLAAPSATGFAGVDSALLERVANVCGVNGCAPVWTKRVQKPPPSFTKMAVPITVTVNQQHQNAAPLK